MSLEHTYIEILLVPVTCFCKGLTTKPQLFPCSNFPRDVNSDRRMDIGFSWRISFEIKYDASPFFVFLGYIFPFTSNSSKLLPITAGVSFWCFWRYKKMASLLGRLFCFFRIIFIVSYIKLSISSLEMDTEQWYFKSIDNAI